jgi:hypothetical protein
LDVERELGTMAKECSPLRSIAILSLRGAVGALLNGRTLPVPLSGSNDWAKAGVAMAVSTAKVVRNFFMSLLLWFEISRSASNCGGERSSHERPHTGGDWKTPELFLAAGGCRCVSDNDFMKQE